MRGNDGHPVTAGHFTDHARGNCWNCYHSKEPRYYFQNIGSRKVRMMSLLWDYSVSPKNSVNLSVIIKADTFECFLYFGHTPKVLNIISFNSWLPVSAIKGKRVTATMEDNLWTLWMLEKQVCFESLFWGPLHGFCTSPQTCHILQPKTRFF